MHVARSWALLILRELTVLENPTSHTHTPTPPLRQLAYPHTHTTHIHPHTYMNISTQTLIHPDMTPGWNWPLPCLSTCRRTEKEKTQSGRTKISLGWLTKNMQLIAANEELSPPHVRGIFVWSGWKEILLKIHAHLWTWQLYQAIYYMPASFLCI